MMKTLHCVLTIVSISFSIAWAEQAETANNTRIVGGRLTHIRNVKYLVNLRLNRRFICGGALINRRFVLTAAHCVHGVQANELRIQGGSSYLNRPGIVRKVKEIFVSPSYSSTLLTNDVAILKLKTPMRGHNAKPIRLCSQKLQPGMIVRISGWGLTSETSSRPSMQVRTTLVRMISRSSCKRRYPGAIQKTMMCAALKGERDSCAGDSGGPLVRNGEVCGIVSWGIGCARRYSPGVYTSVNAVKSFIKRVLKH